MNNGKRNRGKKIEWERQDLFKKSGDIKRICARVGMIKDRNDKDLKEAEEIKKRWQEYTDKLHKKDLNDLDNQDDVVIHLEPNILECEVKRTLGSFTMTKASGAELFKILKYNAVKVLHSKCQ